MTYASVAESPRAWRDAVVSNESENEYGSVELGLRLKAARKNAKLTQEAAAHLIGVASGTLSKYETGDLGMTVGVLGKIADVYRTGTDALLGRETEEAAETRVVVDEIDGLTKYEALYGRLDKRFRDGVIGLARSEGPDAITVDVIDRHVSTLKAIDRGTAQSRPVDVEAKIDEASGQKKGPQRKPKR